MVIRDMICTECGHLLADATMDRLGDLEGVQDCPRCCKATTHRAAATGGLRCRLRIYKWPTDPEFYRGQIKTGAPEAREGSPDGAPITTPGGEVIHEQKAQGHAERETEREDKRYHRLRKTRGTTPLFFDGR